MTIHDSPNDYWRFTPYAFDNLLVKFSYRHVISLGQHYFPHTVIGVGFKGEPPTDFSHLREEMENWRRKIEQNKLSIKQLTKLFLPIGLFFIYKWLRFGYEEALQWIRERI